MNMFVESFVKPVVKALPATSLAAISGLMLEHNVGAVVIVEGTKPVGVVTDRDLALELGARGTSPHTSVVRVMTTPIQTVRREEGVFAATQRMREVNVRRLPVVDEGGSLVGIVTLDDLLRMLSRELSNLVEGIKPEFVVK
jgi:CBS domain-containing protein